MSRFSIVGRVAVLMALLLALFQNCSWSAPRAFKYTAQESKPKGSAPSSNGNGWAYDGKIFVSDLKCPDGTPATRLELFDSKKGGQLLKENCVIYNPPIPVPADQIQVSPDGTIVTYMNLLLSEEIYDAGRVCPRTRLTSSFVASSQVADEIISCTGWMPEAALASLDIRGVNSAGERAPEGDGSFGPNCNEGMWPPSLPDSYHTVSSPVIGECFNSCLIVADCDSFGNWVNLRFQ
ncbi:MAG: hypothetical protein AB7F86_11365 [Bdellovibrionales bacterium]